MNLPTKCREIWRDNREEIEVVDVFLVFDGRIKHFIDRNLPRRSSLSVSQPVQDSFHVSNGRRWFTEADNELLPGQSLGLEINKIIARQTTKYKDILLLNSKAHGKVLVFDGITQATEDDSFAYYEMCAHLPLCCHPNPKKILIVGGLDGSGLGFQLLKHPSVEKVMHCEEDSEMMDFLKTHFNEKAFDRSNPRYEYHSVDAKEFLKEHQEEFDIIITDCTVPLPETEGLFGGSYFELVRDALKPDGITITQSWGIWVELRPPMMLLKENMRWHRNLFPSVDYYTLAAPSFTCGQAALDRTSRAMFDTCSDKTGMPSACEECARGGYAPVSVADCTFSATKYKGLNEGNIICSKQANKSFKEPMQKLSDSTIREWKLQYYNPDCHTASFALPQFAKDILWPS